MDHVEKAKQTLWIILHHVTSCYIGMDGEVLLQRHSLNRRPHHHISSWVFLTWSSEIIWPAFPGNPQKPTSFARDTMGYPDSTWHDTYDTLEGGVWCVWCCSFDVFDDPIYIQFMHSLCTLSPEVVIAATNRADILDQALVRPGRFDRQIQVGNLWQSTGHSVGMTWLWGLGSFTAQISQISQVDPPDVQGRYEILKVHAKGKNLAPGVDLLAVARQTPGMSGAGRGICRDGIGRETAAHWCFAVEQKLEGGAPTKKARWEEISWEGSVFAFVMM